MSGTSLEVHLEKQTEAMLELVQVLRNLNEQFVVLVESLQEMAKLQAEIGRDVVELVSMERIRQGRRVDEPWRPNWP